MKNENYNVIAVVGDGALSGEEVKMKKDNAITAITAGTSKLKSEHLSFYIGIIFMAVVKEEIIF